MKQALKWAAVIVLLLALCSCATGPKFAQIHSTLPELKPETGRIFFYRAGSPFGAAVQPEILLNGEEVGNSVPGGFFYVDRPPGDYEVSCSTEVKRKLTFILAPKETRFVKTKIGIGIMVGRVYPELIDASFAMEEIKDLSYQGVGKKE